MAKDQERKIIVTAAITGAIHTPEMSPYLPVGIKGISDAAIESAKAGASMVHIHARDEKGNPTSDLETFGAILSRIRENAPNVVISITTGGNGTVEQRQSVIPAFRPEISSFNSGSINFAMAGVESTYSNVFINSIQNMIDCIKLMNEADTQPEFEIFDLAMINNVAFLKKIGLLQRTPYFQFVPGPLGLIPMNQDTVSYFIHMVKSSFGEDTQFSMVAPGRRSFRFEAFFVLMGGNVRVGLEDSLYINPNGDLAISNAEQVKKITNILHGIDFEVATPDDTREILKLKGADKVNF